MSIRRRSIYIYLSMWITFDSMTRAKERGQKFGCPNRHKNKAHALRSYESGEHNKIYIMEATRLILS